MFEIDFSRCSETDENRFAVVGKVAFVTRGELYILRFPKMTG
jgi:hypothetical protein